MRLILTSDLHRDGKKLIWLLDEAPDHEALLVGGDLLDIFSSTPVEDQTAGALRWKDAYLKSEKAFAWSSGNHDFFYGDETSALAASPRWMRESSSSNRFVTDGESRLLRLGEGSLVVTTIPWPVQSTVFVDELRTSYSDHVRGLLAEGEKLRVDSRAPWIVLNHEPPQGTPIAGGYESIEAVFAQHLIETAQPDFSLHGHVHQAPAARGGSWFCEVGRTHCFNAGQSEPGMPLHHIILTWRGPGDWSATWKGTGRMLPEESIASTGK